MFWQRNLFVHYIVIQTYTQTFQNLNAKLLFNYDVCAITKFWYTACHWVEKGNQNVNFMLLQSRACDGAYHIIFEHLNGMASECYGNNKSSCINDAKTSWTMVLQRASGTPKSHGVNTQGPTPDKLTCEWKIPIVNAKYTIQMVDFSLPC